jgi:hydroxymethylglutaryl-CoA lyase
LSEYVLINEVGPRDGLQNQQKILDVDEKLRLIESLKAAQLASIEVGSFVSPKAVPAMAGTDQIMARLVDQSAESDSQYSVLIPNMRGFELAYESGARQMNLVVATSDTMNEKNIRMDTRQAMAVSLQVIERAKQQPEPVTIQVYVATAWACPFEGNMSPDKVSELSQYFLAAGVSKIVLADTIGAANPEQTESLTRLMVEEYGSELLSCHFHDTRAMGLANVYAALTSGIRQFDASIAGLGGCPFSPGASGNVATEDVVMMLQQMGYETGISLPKLLEASDLAQELTGSAPGGRAKMWMKNYLKNSHESERKL